MLQMAAFIQFEKLQRSPNSIKELLNMTNALSLQLLLLYPFEEQISLAIFLKLGKVM